MHVGDLAIGVGVLDNAVAQRAEGRVGGPEGAQDDVGGRGDALIGDDLVGDLVDETNFLLIYIFLFSLRVYLRLQTDHITDTVALVANGSADLADGVDELHAHHPLGGGQFNLARKVVDVADQRAQDHTSALGSLGAHGIHHVGRKVRIKLAVGRHDSR